MKKELKLGDLFFCNTASIYGVVVNETQSITIERTQTKIEEFQTVLTADLPDDCELTTLDDARVDNCKTALLCAGIHYGFVTPEEAFPSS